MLALVEDSAMVTTVRRTPQIPIYHYEHHREQLITQELCEQLGMSEVDRLSETLGRLIADSEESRRQREAFFAKLDMLEREHFELSALLRKHMEDFNRHSDEEMRRFDKLIEPTIRDYRATKNRAIGVLTAIAFMGAAAWEGIRAFFQKMGWL